MTDVFVMYRQFYFNCKSYLVNVPKHIKKGKEYRLLQLVYGLGLVAEVYEKTSSTWYHHYQLVKRGQS